MHSLLEDGAGDILLRMDVDGFIESASANIDAIGCDLSQSLIKPHLTDLAAQDFSSKIRDFIALELTRAMNPRSEGGWLEIPVIPGSDADTQSGVAPPVWYALSLRVVTTDSGEVIGLLGLLRSDERSQAMEGHLYSRAQINPGPACPIARLSQPNSNVSLPMVRVGHLHCLNWTGCALYRCNMASKQLMKSPGGLRGFLSRWCLMMPCSLNFPSINSVCFFPSTVSHKADCGWKRC